MLSQKQTLADGVLDGQDDLKAMKLPSGRRAFVERMSAMMAPPAAPVPTALTEQRLRDELVEAHGDGLLSWRRADPPMTARSCWWCWRTLMLRWWNSSGRQRLTIPEIAGSNPGLPATPSQSPQIHAVIPPIARNAAVFGAISGRSSFAVTQETAMSH